MIWVEGILAALIILIVLAAAVALAAWENSLSAERQVQYELDDAYDEVDDVLLRARSAMEDVAYRGGRARQPMSDRLGSWKEW